MAECTSCGETAVETENHNGEEQRVCTSCGVVQERSLNLSSEQEQTNLCFNRAKDLFANQSAPLSIRDQTRIRSSKGRKEGYDKITVLASHFHLTSGMKSEVFDLYNRALLIKTFLKWEIKKKAILAGCCVYAIMRQHDWPVNINQMCNAIGCCRMEMSKLYFKFVKLFKLSIVTAPIEDLVDKFVNECKNIESNEKTVMTSRVHGILQIAKSCWMVDGRSRRPLLLIAVHIAWQSLDFKRGRTSLQDFCKRTELVYQMCTIQRRNELLELLCTLAKKIPWYEPDSVNPTNVHRYLEDILNYSQSLLHDSTIECSGENRQTESTNRNEEPAEISLDFTDKEIDSYIRSEKEVRLISKIKKTLSSD